MTVLGERAFDRNDCISADAEAVKIQDWRTIAHVGELNVALGSMNSLEVAHSGITS